jgi:hypothetical protein
MAEVRASKPAKSDFRFWILDLRLKGRARTPAQDNIPKAGYFRWVICALLFFAATINYIDRQVRGILKPTLQSEIGFNEEHKPCAKAVSRWASYAKGRPRESSNASR